MALLVASTAITGSAAQASTGAAALVPADSHRVIYAAPGHTELRYSEWSQVGATGMIQTSLMGFANWANKTAVDLFHTQYVRQRTMAAGADGESTAMYDNMWTLEADGLRADIEVSMSAAAFSVSLLVPGRLDLPANVKPGDTWTSQGTSYDWSNDASAFVPSPFEASFTAAAPADPLLAAQGCISVAMTQTSANSTRTWCPGLGVVTFTDATGEWALTPDAPPAQVDQPTPFDWAAASQLSFTSYDLTNGPSLYSVSPPGLVQGGTVMAQKYTSDVYGIDLTGDAPQISWNTRPGGTPTAAATLGGITLVANTDRQLVAYAADGRWLWQTTTSDIVVAPPVRMGGRAIVASLDGSVAAVDLATGATVWTTGLGAAIRVSPVVAGDAILISNQSGGLVCLNADGKQSWVADAGTARSMAVSPGPDPVVVFESTDRVVLCAYSMDDGHEVWHNRIYHDARDMIGLDRVVVVRDNDATLGVDWATGAVLWQYSAERTIAGAGGGSAVLLVGQSDFVLLDANGNQEQAWPHHFDSVFMGAFYFAVGGNQVLAYSGDTLEIGVLP